jgi:hypothetical protein
MEVVRGCGYESDTRRGFNKALGPPGGAALGAERRRGRWHDPFRYGTQSRIEEWASAPTRLTICAAQYVSGSAHKRAHISGPASKGAGI